jgi:hypothetical protein
MKNLDLKPWAMCSTCFATGGPGGKQERGRRKLEPANLIEILSKRLDKQGEEMQNLNFNNKDKQGLREFTGHLFREHQVYVGDLVEYRKDGQKEIGEVRRRDNAYLVHGKPLEKLEIVRVINMGGMGLDGRYV